MLDCKISNKLQEAILSMIVHRINRDDLENLEQSFISLDSDFDGLISKDEFKRGYSEYYKDPFAEDRGGNFSDDDEEMATQADI